MKRKKTQKEREKEALLKQLKEIGFKNLEEDEILTSSKTVYVYPDEEDKETIVKPYLKFKRIKGRIHYQNSFDEPGELRDEHFYTGYILEAMESSHREKSLLERCKQAEKLCFACSEREYQKIKTFLEKIENMTIVNLFFDRKTKTIGQKKMHYENNTKKVANPHGMVPLQRNRPLSYG